MNFKQFLSEMPIAQFNLKGDWSPTAKRQYGFSKQDAGILGSEKGQAKIMRKWSNSREEFDLYFVREPNAWKHIEVGEVSPEWVQKNLQMDIQPREEAITIIFTNNRGDQKIPATAWIIAHRLGHAIRREDIFERQLTNVIEKDFRELLSQIYRYNSDSNNSRYSYGGYGYGYDVNQASRKYVADQAHLKGLAQAIGTMKSAKERNLRNFAEFTHELVAQYITEGRIRFGPLPRFLLTKNTKAWGRDAPQGKYSNLDATALAGWNEHLEYLARKYESNLDDIFLALVGKMFVM